MKTERINEIISLVFFCISGFLLASLISYHPDDISFLSSAASSSTATHNWAGLIGAQTAFGIYFVFGVAGYVIPGVLLFWAVCLFIQKIPERILLKIVGFIVMQVWASALLALIQATETKIAAGGLLGYVVSQYFSHYLGFVGTFIFSIFCLLVSFLLATNFLLLSVAQFIWEWVSYGFEVCSVFIQNLFIREEEEEEKERKAPVKRGRKKKDDVVEEEEEDEDELHESLRDVTIKIKKYEDQIKKIKDSKKDDKKGKDKKKEEVLEAAAEDDEEEDDDDEDVEYEYVEVDEDEEEDDDDEDDDDEDDEDDEEEDDDEEDEDGEEEEEDAEPPKPPELIAVAYDETLEEFELPSSDLLQDPVVGKTSPEDLMGNSQLIEKLFENFDIQVKVAEVEQGPVITRYEILPAPGIKLSRIVGLQDDIALALKKASVRIAPVGGKSTVGIEVPNSVTNTVFLKDLLVNASENTEKYSLPMFLGKNTSGVATVADLADMPHILIAGTTGSGKTVCVNAIIGGLLCRLNPNQLRFVMIDPKMVELTVYNGIPHLLSPVVTDPKKAASVLNWIVMEMENRYKAQQFIKLFIGLTRIADNH